MTENIYTQSAEILGHYDRVLKEGGEATLPRMTLAHVPIDNTEIAACVATLGIPFRTPGPYTATVQLDENGDEKGQRQTWWMGPASGGDETSHKTEEILAAWQFRELFESKFPKHPLVPMRCALDARAYWLAVLNGRESLPREGRGVGYATASLREACVLKASGFKPIAHVGRHFLFEPVCNFRPAQDVLLNSHSLEMTAPEQWMRRVLHVLDEMLKVVRSQSVIVSEPFEDQTLLLTADTLRKTREKFLAQLA